MTDQNVSNLPLSCSTSLMKTKASYGAFVFRTRQHFMRMSVLIDTTAAFGEHSSRMRFTSMFEVHQKWTSGVDFCSIVLFGPFFFSENTTTGVVYLDLLEQYVFPQIETFEQETVNFIFVRPCILIHICVIYKVQPDATVLPRKTQTTADYNKQWYG